MQSYSHHRQTVKFIFTQRDYTNFDSKFSHTKDASTVYHIAGKFGGRSILVNAPIFAFGELYFATTHQIAQFKS